TSGIGDSFGRRPKGRQKRHCLLWVGGHRLIVDNGRHWADAIRGGQFGILRGGVFRCGRRRNYWRAKVGKFCCPPLRPFAGKLDEPPQCRYRKQRCEQRPASSGSFSLHIAHCISSPVELEKLPPTLGGKRHCARANSAN